MKYPIGVQSFLNLRQSGYVYVDKTDLVYDLVDNYKYVFLGRPRRFGKSLLLSTIEAYLEGRKELFDGLAIMDLESEWTKHPVLHFDLNSGNYSTLDGLMEILDAQLSDYEQIYSRYANSDSPNLRLRWLIRQAYEQTGNRAVILIDEYDKPVLQAIGRDDLDTAFREVLKPFYGVLKSEDRYIRFGMLTGVSKFGKLSVFSDLNNIEDISLNKRFATICGLTEAEILATFDHEIDAFAKERKVTRQQMVADLRRKYDGYRFSTADKLVYNPFSLLNSIKNRELRDYWFESGTPTFLVKLLEQNDYNLSDIDGVTADDSSLYKVNDISAIPILYQSGYLTIKDYIAEADLFKLGYPNQEVEAGFLKFLLPYYSSIRSYDTKSELYALTREIASGNVEAFMHRLKSIFYSIPYSKDNSAKAQEGQVRNLTYLIFKLLGMQIQVECPMSRGRSDAIVWTADHVYVFEFKVDGTPEAAIAQIRDRGYAQPLLTDNRAITLIGVNYSTTARAITGWTTAPAS